MSLTPLPTALSTPSSAMKRKAASFDDDNDAENVDPVIFLSPKRSKCPDGSSKDSVKPVNFFLSRPPPSSMDNLTSLKPTMTSPRRPVLSPRSPLTKLSTSISKSSPLSAPAGRSPTRKRVGILNRRRTASPFTRVDPPKLGGSGLGFSIDAALSGTIPSYGARQRKEKEIPTTLHEDTRDSWLFDIHEDTADELATNLMEHSTCTLDISSDEESAARTRDERGKENIPPMDDISQTRTQISEHVDASLSTADVKARARVSSRRRRELDEGAIEVDRSPLGEMPAEDFYAEGCDEKSVVIVPAEEDYEAEQQEQEQDVPSVVPVAPECAVDQKQVSAEVVDALMRKNDWAVAPKAALLEPLEKAEAGFQVWESGSPKGGCESLL